MAGPLIILDPEEVAVAGRVQIPLSEPEGFRVFYEGIDWGDQQVKQFQAEATFGARPIDQVWPLRTIKLPLVVEARGTQSFDELRTKLQQWVALVNQSGGGWLKRVLRSGRVAFADIIEAKLDLTSDWLSENRNLDTKATLELQALPDLYGSEIVGSSHEFTGDGSFTMSVKGDMPARVTNMQVEDKSGNSQNGLMFHYRAKHYSSASTAKWAYNAEALGLLDVAEKVTLSGSYGTKVVKHPKLSTAWTPVLSTNEGGSTFLTHSGLYSVWARVYSTSEKLPWLRLVYGVGDIVAPAENTQTQVPGKESFYLVNLGQVNIPTLPFGAQRWEGVIQARGEAGGENISIDRLWFLCADECSGVLGALQSATALSSVVASDSLKGSGALKESEATRGGKWEETGSTKGGFTRASEGAKREAVGESEGRTAVLASSTVGAVKVSANVKRNTNAAESLEQGVYLRYFSSTFWVRAILVSDPSGTGEIWVEYVSGGGPGGFFLGTVPLSLSAILEAEINAAAEVTIRYSGQSFRWTVPSTFKHGEAHAEGKVGIYDFNPTATACVRTYSEFVASPLPPSDAVMYANRSALLSTKGNYRQSEDGLGASLIGYPGGDLPRLPVSASGETTVEVAVKPSRGQFGEVADSAKDAFKVEVNYRPCFAEIPEA